jgi:hypothetical protein
MSQLLYAAGSLSITATADAPRGLHPISDSPPDFNFSDFGSYDCSPPFTGVMPHNVFNLEISGTANGQRMLKKFRCHYVV